MEEEKIKKSLITGSIGLGSLAAAAGAAAFYSAFVEPYWFDLNKIEIRIQRLPDSFKKFHIVHISDFHLGFHFKAKHIAKMAVEIQKLNPDLVVFTGDLVNSHRSLKSAVKSLPYLKKINAPYGKFAVLGNHDYLENIHTISELLGKSGFELLINENRRIKKGEDELYIAGLDDYLRGEADIERALAGIPEGRCTFLLAHEPDYFKVSTRFPVDLQLSGHSHGGQIRLPLFGPIVTSKMGRKYHSGLYQAENKFLYTNRGMGTTHLPFRFFCRPEITSITLK
ncbi:metallophosphoesterase [Fictibacillus terranigra]|uniref:Metallophosphoesterase n=1 Tax=Fictibacillus terranigra TaxID=3058424 RepID=A0ABT8E341_9BACL|nr:metallophosphoesterase [Fictibacillus sp. CENA-BCM004]MDN4072321.1 metallophosphoesterase [Fictibacillus sp. CENA-BCM004]